MDEDAPLADDDAFAFAFALDLVFAPAALDLAFALATVFVPADVVPVVVEEEAVPSVVPCVLRLMLTTRVCPLVAPHATISRREFPPMVETGMMNLPMETVPATARAKSRTCPSW